MTKLTLMCGIPRCGKGTWISKNKGDAIVVSSDVIRKDIFGHQFHQPANKFVFAILEAMVSLLLKQDKNVIVDATHLTKSLRSSWYPVVNGLDVITEVVWVYADKDPFKNLEICQKRSANSAEDEMVPPEVLSRMARDFQPPDLYNEGWISKIIEYKNVNK